MASDLAGLLTEQADPRYADIDAMTTAQLVAMQNAADATVPGAVAAATATIVAAIDLVVDRLRRGGRLIYVGAGTPGRIATLDAAECPPTFGTSYEQVQAVMAGGQPALTRAVEGIEDDEGIGATDLAALEVTGLDVVLGLSASGRTPYVLGAMRHARAAGAATIGLACNAGAAISTVADVGIEVPVGPELVAGSTRLKAGTAQKLVLNMISTIAMVRLGKTHGNLMVDLAATNQKLRVRAERMVREVTGADDAAVRAALAASGQHVKTAIVMIERAVDASTARAMLAAADGRLAHALRAPIGCTPTR
ncbi:MAG: N-acetylmuramic acid 6-phosphate etherase [Pseudonocardiales bacterium]|nr:MAG: N-acetylmuramic acid 6-phosphate etherase [Pseudonocardiales bacterium]